MKNNLCVFKNSRRKVIESLKKGNIDYIADSKWSFSDHFFAFLFSLSFFDFVEKTYPNPRARKNIPFWILIGLMFQLKLNLSNSFYSLPGILKSGAVLTRTSFNIGRIEGGFNRRNKYPRSEGEIIDQDTLRKYFKDTNAAELTRWNNIDIPKFLSSKRAIEKEGIFALDTTHIIVAGNKNYENAEYVPLDKHNRYVDTSRLSPAQAKNFKYSLCYKMVNLLHISKDKNYFIFMGTRITGGRIHDKVLGKELVDNFVAEVSKNKIKLLIMDRGFLDGAMISDFKNNYGIDMLIPLKKNMNAYLDAKGLERLESKPWKKVDKDTTCYMAKKITSWGKCNVSLNIILVKSMLKSGKVRLWSLATTRDYSDPCKAVRDYKLRWQIEERYKQIKDSWLDRRFNSTSFNLVSAHIIFSILVYTLIQVYLNIKSLNRLANRTIDALKADEAAGKNSVIICAGDYYAALDPDEGLYYVAFLKGEALKRFRKWISQFMKNKYRIGGDL
ncbi:transposase [bacterium]|nr:transposase [bacterium]